MELQLFKLFYNERDIDELADEVNRKNTLLEKETRRRDKIDDEIKEKKKEQGKMARDLTRVEQSIKESVSNYYNHNKTWQDRFHFSDLHIKYCNLSVIFIL